MSFDNRIISSDTYIINTINTDNSISEKHSANYPMYHNKKHTESKNFKDTLNSIIELTNSKCDKFEENSTFNNELESALFNQNNTLNNRAKFSNQRPITSNNLETRVIPQLHDKITDDINVKANISTLYEKVKQLNSLKKNVNTKIR